MRNTVAKFTSEWIPDVKERNLFGFGGFSRQRLTQNLQSGLSKSSSKVSRAGVTGRVTFGSFRTAFSEGVLGQPMGLIYNLTPRESEPIGRRDALQTNPGIMPPVLL